MFSLATWAPTPERGTWRSSSRDTDAYGKSIWRMDLDSWWVSDHLSDAGFALLPLSNSFQFKPQEFDDHRDADDAVYELNGKELCSERYEMTASFPLNLVLLALNELWISKLAVFICHHHAHTAFQVIYWWQSPETTGRLRWHHGCNGAFFSGSLLSMLAPDGAEVAAQEWDALVVVVVEAIGPLAAVDPGEDRLCWP